MIRIFFWKNLFSSWYIVKSSWVELFVYMILISCLAKNHCQVNPKPNTSIEYVNEATPNSYRIICYTPKNDPFINNLMDGVRKDYGMPACKLVSFENPEDMLTFIYTQREDRSFAVIFTNYIGPKSTTRANLTYTINVGHKFIVPRTFFLDKKYDGPDYDLYVNHGVLELKQVIDARFEKLTEPMNSSMTHVRTEARRSSKPEEPCDTNQDKIITFGLIFLVIMKKILISLVLVPLVREKETGIRDYLALSLPYAALDDIVFFLNMYLVNFIFIAITLFLNLHYRPFGEITYSYVFKLFILYLLSDMAYTFMLSTFFDTVYFAKIGGILFHYVPFVVSYLNGSSLHKYSFIIGGNLFYQGIEIFHKFSINARNFVSDIGEDKSLKSLYLNLIIQSIVYIFLYFYLYIVIPGKGRKRFPFYFMIQPSFYFGIKYHDDHITLDEDTLNKPGIQLINLTKIFKEGCPDQEVIVDDVNVTIENNCITTLIGPNDSGKSTLINMILGYVSQTTGHIIVDGLKNPAKQRNLIGFSPERNVLLPYLSCAQHLKFFSCLKGVSFTDDTSKGVNLLENLKLFRNIYLPVEKLSAGLKRKLSLGIALSGSTKIVILDQPTSGLDIVSRREIWDMLVELKKWKTILVTTNDMEEAEMLSDNVMVMSKGKIVQSSSALELKYQHECEYILKLDFLEDFNLQETMSLIHESIPKAKLQRYSNSSVYFLLPNIYGSDYTGVLSKLEELSDYLKISNISLTNNFFENAFLHLTKEQGEEPELPKPHEFQEIQKYFNTANDDDSSHESITTTISSREFMAIFYKKLVFIKRRLFFSIFLFSIPLLSIAIAFAAINFHDWNEYKPVCNIDGNKIYIKSSEKFKNLQNTLIDDIRKSNGIPILISEHHVTETILLKLQYEKITHVNERVIGVLEFHTNRRIIKVLHIGNAQNCHNTIVRIINDATSKTREPVVKRMQVHFVDLSGKGPAQVTPRILEYYSAIVPVGWFLYLLFYISLPYTEATTRFKQLQNISPLRYWTAFTFADICLHAIVCVITFLGQKIFDTIYNGSEQVTFMLSFMFYGFGYLPILYMLAGTFKALSTIISCLIMSIILSAVFYVVPSGGLNIIPDIGLRHQFRLINEVYLTRQRNEKIIAMQEHNIFDYNEEHEPVERTTERYYGSMAVALFIFIIILIFAWEKTFLFDRSTRQTIDQTILNDNVLAEKKMLNDLIQEKRQKEYSLLVNNLELPFLRSSFPVPSLSFAVRPGECFGIVGLNDSGKTMTMQQITGNLETSRGVIYIYFVNLYKNLNKYKLLTGYGMQVNSLNDFMTPNEILKYIALLRGLTDNEIPRVIKDWMEKLDFIKFRNIPIKKCSDATKRKLCMSIAMIGKPAVIFLDDPTNGVDPKSRLLMWKCIKQAQQENKTIILTTHNMDECEYLCSRVTILNLGYMRNIGCVRQLKSDLEYGCILTIKLKDNDVPDNINLLVLKLSQMFGGNIIYRSQLRLIRYFVCEQPLLWSSIFARMQQLSDEHQNVIEDYYVKQATIEAILQNIAHGPTTITKV